KHIRKDVTQALTGVEMHSPEPTELAAHWGRIIGVDVSKGADGSPELKLPNSVFRFVKGVGPVEAMNALDFRVSDVAKVSATAKARGYEVEDNAFFIGGVNFRLS